MQKKDLIDIRAFAQTDNNYIYTTWLQALRYGNDWFERIREDIYFENYRRVIDAILAKPTTTISIACLKEDPDVILGFSIHEPGILHFIFVKPQWRRIRLAKDLVPQGIKIMTHLTNMGWAIAPTHWEFNPFAVNQ